MVDRKELETKDALIMAKDGSLKKWDVEFVMGVEIFYNILDFLTELNQDVPMTFYKDRILMNIISYDNTQYADVLIPREGLARYDSGIHGDDNDLKFVVIDMKDLIDEISGNVNTGKLVRVRVDTGYMKRAEFHFGTDDTDLLFERDGDTIIWTTLMDPGEWRARLAKMPGVIARTRNNPDITKAEIVFEPATFIKIANMGGKGRKDSIDQKFIIQADKDGVIVSSGEKLIGRIFRIKNPADSEKTMHDTGQFLDYSGESDKIDKKSKSKGADKHQLLGLTTDELHYTKFRRDYMRCFSKLKGLAPIAIEIRTDMPIIFLQKINGIECMLSVAPITGVDD